jgi:hypothetical protein
MPLTIMGGEPHVIDYSSQIAHQNAARYEADARMNEAAMRQTSENRRLAFEQQRWQDEPGRDAAKQDRAAALEMQAYQGKVSIQEQMENQRKQNQIGAIRSAVDSGYLTQDEANNEILRLQSGVNRTELRQQRDRQQQQNEVHAAQMAEHRHRLGMLESEERLRALTPEQRTHVYHDQAMMDQERNNLRGLLSESDRQMYDVARHAPGVASPEAYGVHRQVEDAAQQAVTRRGGSTTMYQSAPGHWTAIDNPNAQRLANLEHTWTVEAMHEHPIPEELRLRAESSNRATADAARTEMRGIEARRRAYVTERRDNFHGGPVNLPPIFRQGNNGGTGGNQQQLPPNAVPPRPAQRPQPGGFVGQTYQNWSNAWSGSGASDFFGPAAPRHRLQSEGLR